jgi:MYXO-CTERM domain-containing protein
MKQVVWMAGVTLLTLAVVSPAFAVVPEIDPSSAGSALALLVSGVLILAGRRRRN